LFHILLDFELDDTALSFPKRFEFFVQAVFLTNRIAREFGLVNHQDDGLRQNSNAMRLGVPGT